MHLVTHTIWIARRREDVFDFFINFARAPRWRQYVESMAVVGPDPVHVGSRVRVTMDVMGNRQTFELEVLAFERPGLWRHRTFESDFNGYIEYRFESENDGTRVTFTMAVTPVGPYGWLGLPLMWLGRRNIYKEQLPQLKRVMEEPERATS